MRLDPAAREQTVRRLQAQFEACSGQRFLAVGQVLAEIGGEDDVGFFLRVAREDATRREAALWALGQMALQANEAGQPAVISFSVDGWDFSEGFYAYYAIKEGK